MIYNEILTEILVKYFFFITKIHWYILNCFFEGCTIIERLKSTLLSFFRHLFGKKLKKKPTVLRLPKITHFFGFQPSRARPTPMMNMMWGPCNNTVIELVIGQVKFGFWFGGIEIFLSSQIISWGRWVWEWAVWQFAYHHQGRRFETQCSTNGKKPHGYSVRKIFMKMKILRKKPVQYFIFMKWQ